MLSIILFTVFFAFCNCQDSNEGPSYATSVASMLFLLETEKFLIDTISTDLQDLQENIDTIQSFINTVNREHKKSENDFEGYLSNPLNSFALIRRTYVDWSYIIESMEISKRQELEDVLEEDEMVLPNSEDMVEAIKGIERIRRTYKLRPTDMAEGLLNGVKYDSKLSSSDLLSIGSELYEMQEYTQAALWLNVSFYTHHHGMMLNKTFNEKKTISELLLHALLRNESTENMDGFESACRGEGLRVYSNLHCLYNSTMHPVHILAPSKMEILSIDPYVVFYHDVLSDGEINDIIYKTRLRLRRATVFYEGNSKQSSDARTTHDASVEFQKSTMQKVLAITGLKQDGFEEPTVLNYGLGGHYEVHEDFFYPLKEEALENDGDRIATILIYLKDVEQGGNTVFPRIGLSVKPQGGSLLLWYNLKNNGEVDYQTEHGACPVIVGSKWAVTIWVRERAQFQNLPCYDP